MTSNKFTIYIAGDPILDVFNEGFLEDEISFCITNKSTYPGGAWNTLNNLRAISNGKINVESFLNQDPIKLVRLDDAEGISIRYFDAIEKQGKSYRYYPPCCIFHAGNPIERALVITDHNMGSVNSFDKNEVPQEYLFAVIDSKYRTTDHNFFCKAKTKIWRTSRHEYHKDWAEQFDYIILTDGPRNISFGPARDSAIGSWKSLVVPKANPKKAIDTIGAGDTFTAAIAAYIGLNHLKEIDMLLLNEACAFAIECCQDVIYKKHTAITDLKL